MRTNRLYVLLVQLPHPCLKDTNIPLAAGYLKAAAYQSNLLGDIEIEILDADLAENMGCQMLIDAIVSKQPDIIGFSLYLWNVERSLYVISKLKRQLPKLKVIVGGPEVSVDAIQIISNSAIDIAVFGEGEITFVEILKYFLGQSKDLKDIDGICFRNGNQSLVTKTRNRIADLNIIPSPYLLGFIDPTNYRNMFLSTMRGCGLACAYCSWTMRGKLVNFNLDQLRKEVLLAIEKKVSEIMILDSAFNTSPIFKEFCKMVIEVDKDKILNFECFIQADRVDEESAMLLKESGFRSVEVGLQSANTRVLANVNRSMNLSSFMRGVRFLEKAGVRVRTDVIVGLPGDSLETFGKTIEFTSENMLDTALFQLSVGYGTILRKRTREFCMELQQHPPYYVLENNTMTRDDFKSIYLHYGKRSEDFQKIVSLNYPTILLSDRSPKEVVHIDNIVKLNELEYPIRNIVILGASSNLEIRMRTLADAISRKISADLWIFISGEGEVLAKELSCLRILLDAIYTSNPFVNCTIIFEIGSSIIPGMVLKKLISKAKMPSFVDHRNELLINSSVAYNLQKRSLNVFIISRADCKRLKSRVAGVNYVKAVDVEGPNDFAAHLPEIVETEGCSFLINYLKSPNINFVKDSMNKLSNLERNIFFKDHALQRLWEGEFLKKKYNAGYSAPIREPRHYELLIDEDSKCSVDYFDENDVFWDMVLKWKTFKDRSAISNVEASLFEKLSQAFERQE